MMPPKHSLILMATLLIVVTVAITIFYPHKHKKPVETSQFVSMQTIAALENTSVELPAIHRPLISAKEIEGIEHIDLQPKDFNNLTELHIVRIDPTKRQLHLVSPGTVKNGRRSDPSQYTGLTLTEYASIGHYAIVQSGGYLSSWSPPFPLGYVKINGSEHHRTHASYLTSGVFCIDGGNVDISEYVGTEQFKKWPNCIQGGPILIKNGQLALATDEPAQAVTVTPHEQSFICIDNDHNVVLGISGIVSLKKLGKELLRSKKSNGFGCTQAIALSGGKMVGIIENFNNQQTQYGSTTTPLPTAIAVD